ncbi:sensor histidine kinase [Cellulomonas triticagri]|uniref:histidine kinase n=1 Tax=Cellulomonas triticagri TaxID=2483352 RepID=A0A3M2J578_9CELL|nr:histidine kinase [Cellulomonas triticagri]RMI09252.1 hypothetical protein EBM89_11115 [Cellulomonas triticagri]
MSVTPPPAAPTRPRPARADVVAAGVTVGLAVAGLLALPPLSALDPTEVVDVPPLGGVRWWLVVGALAVQAGSVAWARVLPRLALLVVGAVVLAVAPLPPGAASGVLTLAVVVVVYRTAVVVRVARLRAALVAVVLLVAAGSGVDVALAPEPPDGPVLVGSALTQGVVVVLVGLVPALVVAGRRAVRDAQAGEVRALRGEQEARVQAALATQRTAMARELHDIAAHHLSGIALMASAIDRQITTDPDAARASVRQVRDQSRVVLTDLRRLVGLLREDDGAETDAPTLAAVRDLVAAPAAGGVATLHVVGAPEGAVLGGGVGPLAQLTAYRMVQEALANARTHAPGARCAVTVDDSADDAVVVTVRNEAAPAGATAPTSPGGGHGLRGMRERADLVGADLRHGPTPDGGWEVVLRVPRDPTPSGHDQGGAS